MNTKSKSNYPDLVLKHKTPGSAIHKIRGNYYPYKISSKWDRAKKRAQKITEAYLGSITPEGVIPPQRKVSNPTTTKEYGSVKFLTQDNQEIIKNIKELFSLTRNEIVSVLKFCIRVR